MKSTHGGCETSFLLSKFIYRKSYLSTIYIIKKRKKYSANFKNQAMKKGKSGAQAAWTNRGTCAPLPFHVTSGQPAVGTTWATSRSLCEV
ncbi:unnamed protein product [Spirodela intermedia]|uniref:Uncharacterized protein n=1 Tax=Spirodela intermedia TaxID=51605 RepID=A0A7I8JLM8_SPIIN|nr:unnamed protein product [Spirodela intermedia]CAA6670463.1 unnamed protein product [Spirodela intermedia]